MDPFLKNMEKIGAASLMDYYTGEKIRTMTAEEIERYEQMLRDDPSGIGAFDGAEFGLPNRGVYAQ